MPLNDREQQIFADIEAGLREDPKFTKTVGTASVSGNARRQVKLAAVGLVVGFLLLFGIVVSLWFGIAGFALMLLSAVTGGNALKRLGSDNVTTGLGLQLRGGMARYMDDRRGREGNPRI